MKVIILICGSVSFPEEDEERVYGTIYHTIKEKEKGFIVWLRKGKATVEADVLAKLLNPALTMSFVMLPCSSRGFAQEQTNASPFSLNQGHHVAQPLERTLAYGLENVDMKQQQQVCFTPTSSTYTDHSPLTRELVLKTKLRNGILSFEEGDLKFLSPDFPGVSAEDCRILQEKWGHIGEITVKFVSVPRDNLQAVYFGDQGVEMADNDLILLKTRIRKGSVSFNKDDIEYHYPNWKVPEYILKSLRKAANGKLLIISDEKGNLRCHVLTAAKDKVVGMKDKAVATLLSSIPFKKSDK